MEPDGQDGHNARPLTFFAVQVWGSCAPQADLAGPGQGHLKPLPLPGRAVSEPPSCSTISRLIGSPSPARRGRVSRGALRFFRFVLLLERRADRGISQRRGVAERPFLWAAQTSGAP